MLLAGLRGAEPHRVRDLRPRETHTASGEEETRLQPFDLRPRCGQQGEAVQQGVGALTARFLLGAPQREVGEVDAGRRGGCGPPGSGRQIRRSGGQQLLRRHALPISSRLISTRPIGTHSIGCHAVGCRPVDTFPFLTCPVGFMFAFHAATLPDQHNVVNHSLNAWGVAITHLCTTRRDGADPFEEITTSLPAGDYSSHPSASPVETARPQCDDALRLLDHTREAGVRILPESPGRLRMDPHGCVR